MTGQSRIALRLNNHYVRSGTGSYLHALRKYKFTPPPQSKLFLNQFSRLAVKDDQENEIGEVPTENFQNDAFYLCPVTIGTGAGAVTCNLDFDTGSSDLWVFSSLLPKSVPKTGHNIYDPTKSPTAVKMTGSTWQISYGDGSSASGYVYSDTVTVGGIAIKAQAVECAKKLSSAFSSGNGDGLLGLAFGNINTVKPHPVPTPVANMDAEKDIPPNEEIFSCMLTRYDEEPGFYTFGFMDESQAGTSAKVFYTPVIDTSGFWKINSMSAVVNGQVINRDGNTAIADTGTTLCLVDKSLCESIYAQIPGSKYDSTNAGYIFPISNTEESLPTISIGLGDPNGGGEQRFDIMPRDLAFAPAGPGWVYGGFQDRGDMDFDILGDVFLKNVYAVWDVKNRKFGAVARAPGPFTEAKATFLTQGVVLPTHMGEE